MFKPVSKEFDVPRLEGDVIDYWHLNKILSRYLTPVRTRSSSCIRFGRIYPHWVNDWRKAGGFRVEERITIRYRASEDLAATIRDYRDYISEETLAASIVDEPPSGSGFHAEAQLADQWLRVELQRIR